jgi:protein-L-isoaspartate(D-aspartate) O-methyltransferase
LAPDGVLVLPLRMRGNTRCLTLQRRGDHLVAINSMQCGFVAMQGDGSAPVRRVPLLGDACVLVLDDTTQVDGAALTAALQVPRIDVWSSVTVTMERPQPFESLHLWLASQPRPYGCLTVDRERTAGLLEPDNKFVCPTLLAADSFAYLTLRQLDTTIWQFGAHGFGPEATALTAELLDLIAAWDQDHRHGPGPQIAVHSVGTVLPPTDHVRLLVRRPHRLMAITWPGGPVSDGASDVGDRAW